MSTVEEQEYCEHPILCIRHLQAQVKNRVENVRSLAILDQRHTAHIALNA